MKKLILLSSLVFALNATASMDFTESKGSKPSSTEINKHRSCFQELSDDGCGDPGEDPKHFRSCLAEVFPRLTSDCQKMMSELYGNK